MNQDYKYYYKKTLKYDYKSWEHLFCVITSWGGVHLFISEYYNQDGKIEYSCGLETHLRNPPDYMLNKAPSHNHCWLIECPCWHDGTSLYAQEHFLPIFLEGSHDYVFKAISKYCDENHPPRT